MGPALRRGADRFDVSFGSAIMTDTRRRARWFGRKVDMLRGLTIAVSALLGSASVIAPAQAQSDSLPVVRTALNPLVYGHLPIMLANDRGYFIDQKINVVVNKYNGSSTTQIPLIARGDLDIAPVVAGPGLFNAPAQGFDLKVIGKQDDMGRGWNDATWVIVRKDLWDSGAIRTIADLRGHTIDAGPNGSPVNALMRGALSKAGLNPADVKLSTRLATPADWLAALRNNAVDVLAAVEPVASLLVKQGLGVRLVSPQEVLSWYPSSYYVASSDYIAKNRSTTVAFLRAVIKAQQDIFKGGPVWSPDVVKVLSEWSRMSPDDIKAIPTPPYYGGLGMVDPTRLAAEQDFWATEGLVKQRVDAAAMLDPAPLQEAHSSLGIN
jgi:NitT/TauT family transport system substrate-binding protein